MNTHVAPRQIRIKLLDALVSVIFLAIVWTYLGFGEVSVIEEILAVPLVLLVPGGLLIMIVPNSPKDPFLRFALAAGLSIALCVITGLLLNILPTGIDRRTWAFALGLVSMTEAVFVSWRGRAPEAQSSLLSKLRVRTNARTAIVAAVVILAISGGSISIIAWERSNAEWLYHQERFTEIWAQPASGQAVVVGVRSETSGSTKFRLSVSSAGQSIDSYTFTLKAKKTWSRTVSIAHTSKALMLISLFNLSSNQPSQRVWYDPSSSA
jgi:uncharacterized membrane protein